MAMEHSNDAMKELNFKFYLIFNNPNSNSHLRLILNSIDFFIILPNALFLLRMIMSSFLVIKYI